MVLVTTEGAKLLCVVIVTAMLAAGRCYLDHTDETKGDTYRFIFRVMDSVFLAIAILATALLVYYLGHVPWGDPVSWRFIGEGVKWFVAAFLANECRDILFFRKPSTGDRS